MGIERHQARREASVPRRVSASWGFTLLEVLIAVALTAVAGVMAYTFLNGAIDAHSQHAEKAKRLDEINLFFSLLSRDMMHCVDRQIRNEFNEPEHALQGGLESEYLLTFTRGGWPNPRELPRSELQRVAYGLNDTRIERVAWPVLDRVDSENVYKAVALEGVDNLAFRFLRAQDVVVDDDLVGRDWRNSWPSNNSQIADPSPPGLPAAVEITLQLQGWGEVQRVFALGVTPS